MDKATTTLMERTSKPVQDRESAARGGKTAYEIAAEKGASMLDRELNDDERKRAGSAIHWSLGISAGVLYGILRSTGKLGLGSGIAFGLAFWGAMDEGAVTLLGLTPPPREFPWQTHARGAAGHLVLGAVLDGVFAGVELAVETSQR
jgi:hypothetical protein